MFEPPSRQRYREFKQALLQLHTVVTAENPDRALLKENFQACLQIFQCQIASLADNDNDTKSSEVTRWQSLQTEVHRLLRLLEMDVMFLQASRRSATATSRVVSMSDRIKSLISFCDALLEKQ